MEAAIVATPHVAGYSLEGKQNGSMMIYRAFCDWQGIELAVEAEPDNDGCEIHIEHPHDVIDGLLAQCCGVASDDLSLRQAYLRDTGERTGVFDQLRKSYRLRRDFAAWVVHGAPAGDAPALRALGFRLAGS
jgi:erythronate-4-phosphate dehydrogenase